MADTNTYNAILAKQERDSGILEQYTGKIDSIVDEHNKLIAEIQKYFEDDVDEYEKQVAYYDDAKQLMREAVRLGIMLNTFKTKIYDGIHNGDQDNVKKIHDLAKKLHPAMNLASCTDSDATYEAIGGNPRQQWP